MKKCPHCGREYDVTMSFCLDDGSELLYGPAEVDPDRESTLAYTSRDSGGDYPAVPPSESPTRQSLRGTDPTTVLPKRSSAIRRSLLRLIAGVMIVGALALGGFAVYRYLQNSGNAAEHFTKISLSRLTNEGNVELAAISPDGKYVAYLTVDGTDNTFWILHLATHSRVKIAAPTTVIPFIPPTFSPDGNYVYFPAENESAAGTTDLYRVPVLGGPPRKALSNVQVGVSFSPDGSRMAFSRFDNATKRSSILTSSADGNDEKTLVTRELPAFVGSRGVAWSPRGDLIAFDTQEGIASGADIGLISPQGGDPLPMATHWHFVGNLKWLSDQSGLVFPAQLHSAEPTHIWKMSYPGGSAVRLTDELSNFDPSSLSVTSDGRSMVAVSRENHRKIAVGPADDLTGVRNVSSANVANGQAWDPSGKLYYTSSEQGKMKLWRTDANGAQASAVADVPVLVDLNIAQDAKCFVFLAETSGTWQLWKTDANGDNAKQLTNVGNIMAGSSMSPDGKWLFFSTFEGEIWKVPVDGGEPAKISIEASEAPASPRISPDGKMLSYTEGYNGRIVLAAFDGQTAHPLKKFDVPVNFYGLYRWDPDGKSFVYAENVGTVSNLWRQPIDGSPAKKVPNFSSDQISNFNFSPDGKYLAVIRGPTSNDAVLITDGSN